MQNNTISLKNFGKFSALISAIIVFILGESWLIGTVAILGFLKASIGISLLLALLSSLIVLFSENTVDKSKISQRIREWIIRKETQIKPVYFEIYQTSKILGILVIVLIVGPIILSVFTGVLNFRRNARYLLAIICSIIFATFWAATYSGVIAIFVGLR